MSIIRRTSVELRALQVLRTLKLTGKVEDSGVELKGNIPPIAAKKAAQLAGAANASGGDPIVWIFGFSDSGQPASVNGFDFDDWFADMRGQFDGPYPEPTVAWSDFEGHAFLAVAFRTDQAPYVVKKFTNPQEREVPWREGSTTRSASRSEILRTFLPHASLPSIVIVGGAIAFEAQGGMHPDHLQSVSLALELLIEPADSTVLHLAELRSEVKIVLGEEIFTTLSDGLNFRSTDTSPTQTGVKKSGAGLHVYGAGTFFVHSKPLGFAMKSELETLEKGSMSLTLGFGPPVGAVAGWAVTSLKTPNRIGFRPGTPLTLSRK